MCEIKQKPPGMQRCQDRQFLKWTLEGGSKRESIPTDSHVKMTIKKHVYGLAQKTPEEF